MKAGDKVKLKGIVDDIGPLGVTSVRMEDGRLLTFFPSEIEEDATLASIAEPSNSDREFIDRAILSQIGPDTDFASMALIAITERASKLFNYRNQLLTELNIKG